MTGIDSDTKGKQRGRGWTLRADKPEGKLVSFIHSQARKEALRKVPAILGRWFLGQHEPSKFGGLIEDFLYVKHQRQKCIAVCILTQTSCCILRGQGDECLALGTLMSRGMMTKLGG